MQFESTLFAAMYWKRAPFLRLIVPLLAGITLQLYISCSLFILLPIIAVSISGLLLFRLLPVQLRFAAAGLPGVLLFILVSCCGCLLLYQADIRHQSGFFDSMTKDSSTLLLRIEEPLQEKARSFKTTVSVTAINDHSKWMPAKGHLLVYFTKDSTLPCLAYGDEIIVSKRPELIKNSGNPGSFDYRQYCATQQIYHQLYLRVTDFHKLPGNSGSVLTRFLLQARDYCLSNLKKYIGDGPEAGMAEALLIGYRQDLDKDVVQSYSNTGIVHVIAISGMHLALLYGTLLWMLQWLPRRKWTDVLKAVVILIVLWGFALLTGASASVLRSAVMFSGITIGRFVLGRYSSIYNTLAASAFLLLCYNPYFAIDAGFQLSYLAVLSILLFYQQIYRLWQIKSKWGDMLWQMAALSLAAQLITTPVSLFYFHQFPNYFLVANLLAVPLSTVVIYGEVILLFIASFPLPAKWAGWGLKYLILWMNTSVKWLGELPYALIKDIHCNIYQTVFLYLLIAGMALWLMLKWRPGLWLAFVSVWCCAITHALWVITCYTQSSMIVYNVPAYTAIDFVEGSQVQFAGDDSLWQHPAGQQLLAARTSMRVHPAIPVTFQQYGKYIRFHGKQLVIIDSALPKVVPGKKFYTDYILLTHNPHVDIRQLKAFFDCNTFIFAASNSSRRIQQWKSDCYVLTLRFFSVPDQGAYVINF
ncbi:competence protein ComEC [Chitinophaga niastensis]|uniref:Competence protein ComEC n=1 Tax=Chitinophaga niastensis TaxID=536980 RepID=A0A2P8HSB8_CHINA|nr:ComEC/Rec2 family competence protein [Chitinophaga niastensis]PSL49098.1 competence protein ComEC [Chitinophaga niastensis]